MLAILLHRIDEKQGEHLDPLRAQPFFLVQVLADGTADHLALHGQGVHVPPGLAGLEKHFTAGYPQFNELVPFFDPDFTDATIRIQSALGGLFQIVAILYAHFPALHPAGGLNIQLDQGKNTPAFALNPDQANKGFVMGILHHRRVDLNLLNQPLFVGIHRVEPVDHVMFVHMGGGIAQGAERVHG